MEQAYLLRSKAIYLLDPNLRESGKSSILQVKNGSTIQERLIQQQ